MASTNRRHARSVRVLLLTSAAPQPIASEAVPATRTAAIHTRCTIIVVPAEAVSTLLWWHAAAVAINLLLSFGVALAARL